MDEKEKMLSSIGEADIGNGGIFQSKNAQNASADADQIPDADDNEKQLDEKGDHTANRYQDQDDYSDD